MGESPPYHLDSSDFVQWMCGLAPHLSPEQLNDTLSTARQIDTPAERARALIRLSACLAEPEAVALLDEAVSACGAMPETATRTVILAELAARLSPERRGELLAQARQLDDARQRVAALTNLAAHLPKADGVSALYDAITCLPQLAEEKERAAAFQRLTPLLSLELVREALKTAAAMVDPQKRAEAMKALAARLPESERAEALRAVLLAALRITWRPARCTILKELVATTVPADRLIPVWIDVLHAAAAQPRSDLVAELADLAPLMSKVAGARAADSVFTAIETVGRWWP